MKKNFLYLFIILLSFPWAARSQIIYQKDFRQAIVMDRANVLDLSTNVTDRKPLMDELLLKTPLSSFSITLWVKAVEDEEAYEIFNLRTESDDAEGLETDWVFGKQANGAWYWYAKKGKQVYSYMPTGKRQPITKRWCMIGLSYNAKEKEVSLYYNGVNTAIYYVPELTNSVLQKFKMAIGGTPGGEVHQRDTFNGYLSDIRIYSGVLTTSELAGLYGLPTSTHHQLPQKQLKVMTYNIFHGGTETGKRVGPQRVAEVIEQAGADVVAMQETYGSGATIADQLGYYFYLRSDNLSIMSRYPIVKTLHAYHQFYSGAAVIDVGGGKKVVVASNWLNYPLDYWDSLEKGISINAEDWLNRQQENAHTLNMILEKLKPAIDLSEEVPFIFCGDFNSGSHRDWIAETKGFHNGYTMSFPSTKLMESRGFKDSFRSIHPNPLHDRGITWSPFVPTAFPDRIDYIFYKGKGIMPIDSETVNVHPVKYPSDHAAVVTTFEIKM